MVRGSQQQVSGEIGSRDEQVTLGCNGHSHGTMLCN